MPRLSEAPLLSRRTLLAGVAAGAASTALPALAGGEPGPRFSLVDQNGRTVTEAMLQGKPSVVHIGFTRCPVICPTTLYELSQRMAELGPDAEKINFVFVTVDPGRDTPAILKEYVGSFDDRILALGGHPAAVKAMLDGLGATVNQRVDESGETTFDHTYVGFILDRRWDKAGTLFLGTDANVDVVTRQLKALAASA